MSEQENPELQSIRKAPEKIINGKDELNFAEFPIGVLSTRAPEGQKSLSFKRNALDRETGKPVTREVRITAPMDASLPTATDDEVVLALIQHSKIQNFQTRKVYFTRYQLLKILKWKRNGQNYHRLSESLDRLARVDYRYLNAWFDKGDNRWKDATFQILDAVVIDQKEDKDSRPLTDPNQQSFEFASSWFTWSEIVYDSLQVGFMKTLNYDFATSLRSKTTLRLFRFLDKRFWHRSQVEFDLAQLGYEHIGISRNSPLKQVKREIQNATLELEGKGYLKALPLKERFVKLRVGKWRVFFEQAERFRQYGDTPGMLDSKEPDFSMDRDAMDAIEVCNELIRRRISVKQARKIVEEYDGELVLEKISQFDFLMRSDSPPENPQGYLFSSITDPSWEAPRRVIKITRRCREKRSCGKRETRRERGRER